MKLFPLLIDGELLETDNTFVVEDPSDQSLVGHAALAGPKEVNLAVESAKKAWPKWADMSFTERARIIRQGADAILQHIDELATLYTREHGKPLSDSRNELSRLMDYFISYADMTPLIRKELADATTTATAYFTWQPIGVVGLIIPWNSPLVLGAIKLPAALLAGNTVVIKPPSYVPLTWMKIGEILRDKFPPGVINIVAGPGSTVGEPLVAHCDVGMISFTGDTTTGKLIMSKASVNLKKLTLELGGNDAAIFLKDASLDEKHIERLLSACFRNTGQVCMATKRIFVHRSIIDDFCRWFVDGVSRLKVGPGFEKGVDIGPLNNRPQLDFVEGLIDNARQAGANILCGGRRPEEDHLTRGFFYQPTVILTEDDDLGLVKHEQFGPVVPVLPFDGEEEVVFRANNTPYGLGGSVWSKDIGKALRIASQIRAGVVWINAHSAHFLGPMACYGGFKESGLGREKGIYGIEEYMERQTLCTVF